MRLWRKKCNYRDLRRAHNLHSCVRYVGSVGARLPVEHWGLFRRKHFNTARIWEYGRDFSKPWPWRTSRLHQRIIRLRRLAHLVRLQDEKRAATSNVGWLTGAESRDGGERSRMYRCCHVGSEHSTQLYHARHFESDAGNNQAAPAHTAPHSAQHGPSCKHWPLLRSTWRHVDFWPDTWWLYTHYRIHRWYFLARARLWDRV